MKYLKLLLCLLFAICCIGIADSNGQSNSQEPEAQTTRQNYQLELVKIADGKIKQFNLDDKVFYRLINEKRPHEGRLTGVEQGAFYIDGEKINISEVLYIGREMPARILMILVAIPVMMVGIIWTGFAGFVLLYGAATTHTTFLIGGIMDLAVGSTLTLGASLPMIFLGKRYKTTTGFYELRTVVDSGF